MLSTTVNSGGKLQHTAKRNLKTPKVVCHHNMSKQNVVIDGHPYKCNNVMVKGNVMKSYTKYFLRMMVMDKTDGGK
jgi:hypothetical protein